MLVKPKKQFLYLFMLILLLSFASASIEDFVNSLTFDYNTGLFNITPKVYAIGYQELTYQELNDSVREVINNTYT